MSNMNVLHLSAVKNWGGGGNHVENLCYELSKTNPEIKNIIIVGEGGQFHERLKKSNFNFDTLPLTIKIDPRAIFKLIKLCKAEKIDLIHIHGPASLTLAVIANKFTNLPPFIFSKKTSFPIKKRKQTLYKYNHPKIKKFLCVSDTTKRVSEEAITDKSKLKTIYHGTRIDNKSTETPFTLKEKFKIPDKNFIVGSIGNHIKAKDLDTWVDTIDILVNDFKLDNLRFVQIGSFTDLTPVIKNKIESLGIKDKVHFLGYLPNASNFINQFDVLLFTSKSEGLPQVIYEAFYHHTPVISTNVGGIPEVIENGVNGYLSNQGDSRSLAQNTVKVLNDPELIKDFTERGFKKLIPKYTSENMAKETLQEYKIIVNSVEK